MCSRFGRLIIICFILYLVVRILPEIHGLDLMLETLNLTGEISGFVVKLREKFKAVLWTKKSPKKKYSFKLFCKSFINQKNSLAPHMFKEKRRKLNLLNVFLSKFFSCILVLFKFRLLNCVFYWAIIKNWRVSYH